MRKAETLKLHRRQAFAGFLIVSLIALIGFAAFSATGFSKAPPLDLPESSSGRIAGQILGVEGSFSNLMNPMGEIKSTLDLVMEKTRSPAGTRKSPGF